jgi:hypothetical protein
VDAHLRVVGPLAGCYLLALALFALDKTPSAFQLIGTFYPVTLYASALLLALALQHRRRVALALVCCALTYASLRVPRFAGSFNQFVTNQNPTRMYSLAMFDDVERIAGAKVLLVDTLDNQASSLFRAEIFRRNLRTSWTADSARRNGGPRLFPFIGHSTSSSNTQLTSLMKPMLCGARRR